MIKKKYYRNLLENSELGKSLPKPEYRKNGKYSVHPDNELYTRMSVKAVDNLLRLGVSEEEIKTYLEDGHNKESMFYGR
jgi:hypothetical protein